MSRIFAGILLGLAIIAAAPFYYCAYARVMGTRTEARVTNNGIAYIVTTGPNAPRPNWVPVPPHALYDSVTHYPTNSQLPENGDVILTSFNTPAETIDFYTSALTRLGFEVEGHVRQPGDANMASFLGIDAALYAVHRGTNAT